MPAATSWGLVFIALLLTLVAAFAPLARAGAPLDARIWAELARPATLRASFDQVQHRKILAVPLASSGQLQYDRARSALVWEVLHPARSRFSLEGSLARMEQPDLGISETFDLAAVPDANRVASAMLVWLRADAAAVERDFRVQFGTDTVRLEPRDPTLSTLLAAITITFVPEPWRVARVELLEPDADRVLIHFHDVVLDGVAVPDP